MTVNAGGRTSPESENLQVLLEHKAWFEQLLDLRTRELRRRERGGVLDVADEVEEERALRASLDARASELDARVATLSRQGLELPFRRLADAYQLSPLETRILLLGLLPAIDTGFRMRIARYKDNILFNYIDVDLVVSLFFDTDAERLVGLRLFAPDAPLVRNRLVRLVHHPDLTNDDLINQETRLPERVVNFLLGHRMLATHLAHFADLREPRATFADVHVPDIDKRRVREVIGARKAGRTLEAIDRPQLIVCSVDYDHERAIDSTRMLLCQYLAQQPHIAKASGVSEEVVRQIQSILGWPATKEQINRAKHLVPEELIHRITASGTPAEARVKVMEYCKRGCTCPILYPVGGDVKLLVDTFEDF